MNFVRQSKFRHVFCKPLKHEFCLNDVRITKISYESLFCAVNAKFVAFITEGSGGPFMVFPLNKTGRVEKDHPVVDAHKGPCLEIAWCPFNDNVIASCSEDCLTKVWHIPDIGLVRTLKEPLIELSGHQRRVTALLWHPTANSVLLTAGERRARRRVVERGVSGADMKILLWNVGTGEALIEIAGHPDLIWSVAFNYNGSKIVTTCKDKKIRVIDPRTGRITQQGLGHEGVKPQRAIFLRDGRILSTGFTKRSERMYSLRDEEALDEPITQEELDTSNGVLYPLYDPDSGLLYLAGKGDCNIRYYEVNNDFPFIHFINIYSTPEPQRGIGFMPKLGIRALENEINRIYKCTNKGQVEVLQFYVPRKSELFQDDLFPDTAGGVPALSADEWMEGKDADPLLVPVVAAEARQSAAAEARPKATVGKKANILSDAPHAAEAPTRTATAAARVAAAAPPPSHVEPAETRRAVAPARHVEPRIRNDDAGIVALSREQQSGAAASRARPADTDGKPSEQLDERVSRAVAGAPSWADRTTVFGNYSRPRDEPAEAAARPRAATSTRPASVHNSVSEQKAASVDSELFADVQKLKAIVKKHERRIRYLEDMLAEKESHDIDYL